MFGVVGAQEPFDRFLGQPRLPQVTRKNEGRGGVSAAKALDRLSFPPEALAAITELVKPGSSLIVSDETNSQYFGNGTDFSVAIH